MALDLLKHYWFLAGVIVLVIVLMLSAWLHRKPPTSASIDSSSGHEGSYLTMWVPRTVKISSEMVAVFSRPGGIRFSGKTDIVGYEKDTASVRIHVPDGICGIAGRAVAYEDMTITLSDAKGNSLDGAPTPTYRVACQ